MVRFDSLVAATQETIMSADCIEFADKPWVTGPPLAERKIAMITSAGMLRRGGKPFRAGDRHFYDIPNDFDGNDLLLSHVSVSFDRTGFQQDVNVMLPRDRMAELAADGVIGAVADTHYSFMGATDPKDMEKEGRDLATRIKADGVDSVVLLPV